MGCDEAARMSLLRVVTARPRLFASALIGICTGLALPAAMHGLTRGLLAWDAGCLAFLILSAHMFSVPRPGGIAADAERQEEGEWTIFWITIGAVTASFAAIIGEFAAAKGSAAGLRIALVAATLLLSWLLTHTLFALRYAHEYYELTGEAGAIVRGLEFPGDVAPDYWDFFYFSLVLGMTFQVSDVQITSRKLRRLAAAHGLLGFLFNTVILALSVNIGAGLL
jgi:uncharacterized membrane protein